MHYGKDWCRDSANIQYGLLAYSSGPQEWTYSVTPDHINVKLPRNIEDIHIDSPNAGQLLSTPTAMSYTLCRVQIAFASRRIADETAIQHFHGKEVPYKKIVELNHMLRDSLEKLPEFYRFGQAHNLHFATLYQERPVPHGTGACCSLVTTIASVGYTVKTS